MSEVSEISGSEGFFNFDAAFFPSENEKETEGYVQAGCLFEVCRDTILKPTNLSDSLRQKKVTISTTQTLVNTLAKYSNNQFNVNPLSYAIYVKDYEAAIIMLEHGFNPNRIDTLVIIDHVYRESVKVNLSPLDFLFIDEIEGRKEAAEYVIPRRTCRGLGINKGKLTFQMLSEIEPLYLTHVKKLTSELLKRNQSMMLRLTLHQVGGQYGDRLVKIDFYKELIKSQWNDILKEYIRPSQNIYLNEAIYYDNHEFFEYTICRRAGDRYLESSLNFVLKNLGHLIGDPVKDKLEWIRMKNYIIKLLDHGAKPDIQGSDGYRPLDVVLKWRDSERKREILSLFFEYGAEL